MQISIADVRREFDLYYQVPFPWGHRDSDEQVRDIHADLAQYDGYIAGSVTTLLKGDTVPIRQFVYDQDLEDRITKALATAEPFMAPYIQEYFDYMQHLKRLVNLIRSFYGEKG